MMMARDDERDDGEAMAGGRGGSRRTMMLGKTESQRLFESDGSGRSAGFVGGDGDGGSGGGGGARGKGGGGVVRAGRLRGGGRRGNSGGGGARDPPAGRGGPTFRPPLPTTNLDHSNRSAESELSGTSGAWNEGAGGGVGHTPDHRHRHHPPPPQSRGGGYPWKGAEDGGCGGGGGGANGDYYEDLQHLPPSSSLPPPPTQPPSSRRTMRLRRGQQLPSVQSQASYSTQSLREIYNDDDDDVDEALPVSPLRQLLDAINMSILPTSLRLSSLAQAVEFFDHRDNSLNRLRKKFIK